MLAHCNNLKASPCGSYKSDFPFFPSFHPFLIFCQVSGDWKRMFSDKKHLSVKQYFSRSNINWKKVFTCQKAIVYFNRIVLYIIWYDKQLRIKISTFALKTGSSCEPPEGIENIRVYWAASFALFVFQGFEKYLFVCQRRSKMCLFPNELRLHLNGFFILAFPRRLIKIAHAILNLLS